MHPTVSILSAKSHSVRNKLVPLPPELAVSLPVLAVMAVLFFVGGFKFFFLLFKFLRASPPFGIILTERLLGMVFLAFFSMLTFSNVVTSLTTLYLAGELEFLFARPVPHACAFFAKFWESVLYSSSAFVVMGLPLFLAYGVVYQAPLLFYPMVLLFYAAFLIIPAAAGTLVTMLLARIFPARKTRTAFCALFGLLLAVMALVAYLVEKGTFGGVAQTASVSQLMQALEISQTPFLPHHWMAQGIIWAAKSDMGTAGFYLLVLVSTALAGLQACAWLAPTMYYPGWARTRESEQQTAGRITLPIFRWVEVLMRPLPRPTRALLLKDLKAFWRDPGQWAQLALLFGLLVIYISNLRHMPIDTSQPFWQSVISFFNMSATCFVLATVTSRFIFPMWSLEGQQFWVVGLAPLSRRQLFRQKLAGCVVGCLAMGEGVMMYSNYMLRVPPLMLLVSGITVGFISTGLASLAFGLGAVFPNFREDNASRIANGAGGTLNVVVSLLYIGALIAVEVAPLQQLLVGHAHSLHEIRHPLVAAGAAFTLLNAAAIGIPLWLGFRAVDRMEL